jgi:ubiquinone/menaquinone biosynthesis C-methylase UbiE
MMDRAYFQADEYVAYLREHCSPGAREDNGRVPGTEFSERVLSEMRFKGGENVLEIGCGLGRVLQLLEGVWGVKAHGCDISVPGIAEAKRLLPALAERLFVSDAEHIAARGPFDHVVYWGVFEMTEQRLALAEVSRLLRLGGTAMLSGVKSRTYFQDDGDALAAHRAYIAKGFPITFTDLPSFEQMLNFLGLRVDRRLVFERKGDISAHRYRVILGSDPLPARCSDIYYIVEKCKITPLDAAIQYQPSEVALPANS